MANIVSKAKGKTKAAASLSEIVRDFTENMDLSSSNRPESQITQMAENPTILSPKKVQLVYTAMVAWYCYTNEALANVTIDLLEVEYKLRKEKAVLHMVSKASVKWKADDEISINPVIQNLELRRLRLEGKRIALETIAQNYDAKAKAMSRELTRRGVEYSQAGKV